MVRCRVALLPLLCALACFPKAPDTTRNRQYTPVARDLTITTVPVLVKEMRGLLPFLGPDFAPGGILEGKEVYAFVPNHFTVGEGDTLRFTFYNPEDDLHSFVLPTLSVALPGQTLTRATYIASTPGILTFLCSVPAHLPMMQGELVVLPAPVMARMEPAPVHQATAPAP
jgi:hypothetical protein